VYIIQEHTNRMKNGLKICIIALLGFTLLSTVAAYGLVIQDIVVCTDFDANGVPIPNNQVPVTDDAVFIWVNMTDIHVNETLYFEWWSPNNGEYFNETWVAPAWIENNPSYSTFFETEIMGEPAENMPGEWVVNVLNNGTWWGHVVFDLIDDNTALGSSMLENVPTGTMAITNIQTPDGYNVGENVSVKVTVAYSFDTATDIAPSIWDNSSMSFVGGVNDNVNGQGSKTYDIVFVADDPGTVYFAVGYYTQNENIVYDNQTGLVSFRLEDKSTDVGISTPSIQDLGLPDKVNVDEIKNQITTYVDQLKNINVTIPDELSGIKEQVEQQTGIPGFPIGALFIGAAALIWVKRCRH